MAENCVKWKQFCVRKIWEVIHNFIPQGRKILCGELQFLEKFIVLKFLDKKYGILEMQVSVYFKQKTSFEFFKVFQFKVVFCGCETKPPNLEWDKIADFFNERKPPILKWDKIADF